MKTHRFPLFTLGFALLFCFRSLAHAFFDPTIGKWASRDPVNERGGLNLTSFDKNNLVNSIDPLGLMAFNLGYSCYCKCETVEVTFNPGGNTFQWGWLPLGGGTHRLGNDIQVKWKVTGNPIKCSYYQKDQGFMWMNPVPVGNRSSYKNYTGTVVGFLEIANTPQANMAAAQVGLAIPTVSYGTIGSSSWASYVDGLGKMMTASDAGGWEVTAELTITLKCKSSDGTEKTLPGVQINNPVGSPFSTSYPANGN